MDHKELVEKLKLVKKKKGEIEVLLGMPINSLSGMMNDPKRMPRKWFEALESFVIGSEILVPEIHPAKFPGMTHKESGDTLLKLLDDVPGLKKASEIPPLSFDGPKIFPKYDEPSQYIEVKESENELLGKAVGITAKKLKKDPYELLAWVVENFGKKSPVKKKQESEFEESEKSTSEVSNWRSNYIKNKTGIK